MAFISVMFLTLLFGIFEYCRFLFVYNLTHNAARDAGRSLAVKTNGGNMPNDSGIVASPAELEELVSKGILQGKPLTTGMAGLEKNIDGFTIEVFVVDPAGLTSTPPVIQPLKSAGVNIPWNHAGFGDKIAVRIRGSYRPIAAGLLFLPSQIPFEVTVMTTSEGN
jgi:hypothetical protein